MSLLEKERERYSNTWAIPEYSNHSPGEQNIEFFLQNAAPYLTNGTRGVTVLDAGCGSGKGAAALSRAGFRVKMVDITSDGLVEQAKSIPYEDACLWHWHSLYLAARAFRHPGANTFDFVYCCDVLEHIPPQFTMLSIANLLRVSRYGLFLSISLVPDNFGIWVGEQLHNTVQPFTWWRDSLRELGTLHDARDLITNGVFFISEI